MTADADNEARVNALLADAQKLRRQAQETGLAWYRKRLLQLARDFETKASELDDADEDKKKGPDDARPSRH